MTVRSPGPMRLAYRLQAGARRGERRTQSSISARPATVVSLCDIRKGHPANSALADLTEIGLCRKCRIALACSNTSSDVDKLL